MNLLNLIKENRYNKYMFKLISLFSGCGGLDLGFELEGFEIVFANDCDKICKATYEYNFPGAILDGRKIENIKSEDFPNNIDGIIGGSPCQSWSVAGSNKGEDDPRGRVFFEYLRVINDMSPKFFVIENVEGILRATHRPTLTKILSRLTKLGNHGYNVRYELLNANLHGVPQDRKRVFFIGIRKDLQDNIDKFKFPTISDDENDRPTLKDAIYDLCDSAKSHKTMKDGDEVDYYYLEMDWSSQFMSRNRVRTWDQAAFTVPATGRQVTIHPQAPVMKKVRKDVFEFDRENKHLYRRFTVRECARLQTFPDSFKFKVDNVNHGYKLIGNAVPVNLARKIAKSVFNAFI
tara:strand:+ start:9396 stop:10439 length:1044 start_codon:yes stop_codon:yes gene_type:complete